MPNSDMPNKDSLDKASPPWTPKAKGCFLFVFLLLTVAAIAVVSFWPESNTKTANVVLQLGDSKMVELSPGKPITLTLDFNQGKGHFCSNFVQPGPGQWVMFNPLDSAGTPALDRNDGPHLAPKVMGVAKYAVHGNGKFLWEMKKGDCPAP